MGGRALVGVEVEERRDGTVLITVVGELDVHTRLGLARALARHESSRVLLDLERIEFADSAGLNAVMGASSAAARAGGSVEIVAVSPAVRRLLSLTKAGVHLLRKNAS